MLFSKSRLLLLFLFHKCVLRRSLLLSPCGGLFLRIPRNLLLLLSNWDGERSQLEIVALFPSDETRWRDRHVTGQRRVQGWAKKENSEGRNNIKKL